jgi:hypothetical protein
MEQEKAEAEKERQAREKLIQEADERLRCLPHMIETAAAHGRYEVILWGNIPSAQYYFEANSHCGGAKFPAPKSGTLLYYMMKRLEEYRPTITAKLSSEDYVRLHHNDSDRTTKMNLRIIFDHVQEDDD